MARLQRAFSIHTAAANGFSIDHGDVGEFTKRITRWLESHASEVGAWSEAARMETNSAGAERIFSLLKILFGSKQDTNRSDYICGSIILRYSNKKSADDVRK
jgi:hypothetical protein